MDPFSIQTDIFSTDTFSSYGFSSSEHCISGTSSILDAQNSLLTSSAVSQGISASHQSSATNAFVTDSNLFQDDFLTSSTTNHQHMISHEESSYVESTFDEQGNSGDTDHGQTDDCDVVSSTSQEPEVPAPSQLPIPDLEAMTSILLMMRQEIGGKDGVDI